MGTYRQYCPIARASEILAERWNPLIVRNLMFGADTFSAIAGGVPTMSRSMLIKRLHELERAGVIESRPKPDGRGHLYELTEAGADLAGVLDGLAAWGDHWVDVTPRPLRSRFRAVGVVPGAARPIGAARRPGGHRLHLPRRASGQSAVLAVGRARRRRGLLLRSRRGTRPDGRSAVAGVRGLAPRRTELAGCAAVGRRQADRPDVAASILPRLEPACAGRPGLIALAYRASPVTAHSRDTDAVATTRRRRSQQLQSRRARHPVTASTASANSRRQTTKSGRSGLGWL